jgi:para-aminobenzoate synthetase component I
VQYLDITADELVLAILGIAAREMVCLLDSSGVKHTGSHLMIAGIRPVDVIEFPPGVAGRTYSKLNGLLAGQHAAFFTLSYELGSRAQKIVSSKTSLEPDVFISLFDVLIVHDYEHSSTRLLGNSEKFDSILNDLKTEKYHSPDALSTCGTTVRSDFSRAKYLEAIEAVKEKIRSGDTYQTNLTQQLTAKLPEGLSAQTVFHRLRRNHPAPYSAFVKRPTSTVVSASPERFFKIQSGRITTSPIKGTRPRGDTPQADRDLRTDLLASQKDRAENTMIVDLLRNDLGRVCEYGSVGVEKLCDLEEHPTLFHLVSTISGELRRDISFSEVLKALFPCGSITGAPKISTMRIIDEIERSSRGLSMGAIGYRIPESFGMTETIEMSVAIRTMVIRNRIATFNVGGGIVIDSDPESEYQETLTKARALLEAIGAAPEKL